MLGTVSGLAFYHVPDPASGNITGLNWRIMLGSAIFPSMFVMAFAPFLPESVNSSSAPPSRLGHPLPD